MGQWDRTGQDTQTLLLDDAASHTYGRTHTSGGFSEVRHIQFVQWDENQGTCLLTETRPDGTVINFQWNPNTLEFERASGSGYSWKHRNEENNTFAFRGVYPSLDPLGLQQYLVSGSQSLQGSTIVHVLDEVSDSYSVA